MITGIVNRPFALPFFQQGHPIGVGHPDIEQDQIGSVRQPQLACAVRVLSRGDDVSFITKNFREQLPDAHFVVDH